MPEPEIAERIRRAELDASKVWRESLPITEDCVAGRYLAGRKCTLPHPDGDLRWHPAQYHWRAKHTGPALVALLTDAKTCAPRTIHLTWLRADGSGKADLEQPRLYWYRLPKIGVLRLWSDAGVTLGLCVAEGIETALVAARGFGLAWATVDKGNLAGFPVLDGLECLTVVADNDPDGGGLRAANECRQRWRAAGVQTRLWISPHPGADLADWVLEEDEPA